MRLLLPKNLGWHCLNRSNLDFLFKCNQCGNLNSRLCTMAKIRENLLINCETRAWTGTLFIIWPMWKLPSWVITNHCNRIAKLAVRRWVRDLFAQLTIFSRQRKSERPQKVSYLNNLTLFVWEKFIHLDDWNFSLIICNSMVTCKKFHMSSSYDGYAWWSTHYHTILMVQFS